MMKNGNNGNALPPGASLPTPSAEVVELGERIKASHQALLAALGAFFAPDGSFTEEVLYREAREAYQSFRAVEAEVNVTIEKAKALQAAQTVAPVVATEAQIEAAVEEAKKAKRAILENPGNGAQWIQLGWTLLLMPQEDGTFRLTAKLLERRAECEQDYAYLGRIAEALGMPYREYDRGRKEPVEGGVYSFVWLSPEQLISKGGTA